LKESSLWAKIKAAKVFDWAERIESITCPGIPDVHGVILGLELWVELKVSPVVLRPAQVLWHRRWHSLGQRNGSILAYGPKGFALWPSGVAGPRQRDLGPPEWSWAAKAPGWVDGLRDALTTMCEQDHQLCQGCRHHYTSTGSDP
jgi:hypothetical protein